MKLTDKIWAMLAWMTVVFLLANAKRLKRNSRSLSWSNCGGPDKVLHLTYLDISPIPVNLPGVMYVSYDAYSTEAITGAALKLSIKRSGYFDIPIPCFFNIGSCTYDDMCTLLDTMRREDWFGISADVASQVRALLQSSNLNGTCPVPPTSMTVRRHAFQMPELPWGLRMFSDGYYKVNFEIIEPVTNRKLGCFNVNLSIKNGERGGWFFRQKRRAVRNGNLH